MKIPWLWGVFDREYPDEGSALIWAATSHAARREGVRLLQLPIAHVAVSQMTVGALWRRWRSA